ncbi:MAG: NUDIX domain-containing protein [Phycisphaerales bacterium]|nr:NUDIX domain-containing protein [Phycisphaerales bacterium]
MNVIQGVVVVVHREGRFLMIQRAPHILAGGAWCFVGGGIEPGESQEAAVVREFREEVGGGVRPLGKVWEYTRPDGMLILHWWLAELEDDALTLNFDEVTQCRWCTPEEIDALTDVLESNRAFLREVGRALLLN